MPNLNESLTALVNFLASINSEKLGPSGKHFGSKRVEAQSEDSKNHSRALLLLTDLFVKKAGGKFHLLLSEPISNRVG